MISLEERLDYFGLRWLGRSDHLRRTSGPGLVEVVARSNLPPDLTPMGMRLPSKSEHPIGFAHRGARAHAPENTPEAFDLAVKLGATGVESDVWLSNDGQLILNHDGHVGMRRRQIRNLDRSELPDTLITLPELVERLPANLDISIDIKEDTAMIPLLEWAAELDPITRGRLYLCHHNWEQLADWRSIDPHVRLVDSTSIKDIKASGGPEKRAHMLAEAGIDAVNLRQSEWSGGMATLFHRFDRLCFGWDAQHERILRDLLRMGLDGLYSDHVDVMMEAIDTNQAIDPPEQPKIW